MKLQPDFRCPSLSTLATGCGWEIPMICHDTGVRHGDLSPESQCWEWADSKLWYNLGRGATSSTDLHAEERETTLKAARAARARTATNHAENKTAGRIVPFFKT